jgi:heme-degrading monooxygenase HmoA
MRNATPALHLGSTVSTISAAAASVALLAAATGANGQGSAENDAGKATPVVAIVRVPKPWFAPKMLVVSKMRDTTAEYARLPGLAFKAFSLERESADYGGLYYWRDRASAQAWFNQAWFERVRKERGHDANVRFYDAPVSIDNSPGGTPASLDSATVATLVEIAIPAGISRERLAAEFKAAVPVYQAVPGLLRKHFTVSDAGTFGGVYVWKDEAHAKAWFNQAWHDRVRKTYGQDAKIEWFDTPILLPTQNSDNTLSPTALVVAAP